MSRTAYTPKELRALAKDPGPFFEGNARAALNWQADLMEVAQEAIDAELARVQAAERRAEAAEADARRLRVALIDTSQWLAEFAYSQGATTYREVMYSPRMQAARVAIASERTAES
jgi:hypothetical protein